MSPALAGTAHVFSFFVCPILYEIRRIKRIGVMMEDLDLIIQEEAMAPVIYTHVDTQTPMTTAVGVTHGEEADFGTTTFSVGAGSLWMVDR